MIDNPLLLDDPATAAGVRDRSRDIGALAWTLLLLGLLGWASAMAIPFRPPTLLPTAGLLAVTGLGLLRRERWARPATMALFIGLILAQLGQRWLEVSLLNPILDAFGGVHLAGRFAAATLIHQPLPLRLGGAIGGALLCVVMGWYVVRLGSHAVRIEFDSRR
ncbi:hypothetical protein ACWA7J_05435 [Leptothrix sp. BB-4]